MDTLATPGAALRAPDRARKVSNYAGLVLLIAAGLASLTALPRLQLNVRLAWSVLGVAAGLAAWAGLLWVSALRRGRALEIEWTPPLKSHYIQSTVQLCIYAYWGWYVRSVYDFAPLLIAQLLFLYAFDALLSWSRGRSWRLGFGPVPVILSTNVFMWFKDDWFAMQFVVIGACALGKEFLRWNRNGKNVHIFNPSAFGLSAVGLMLIATRNSDLTLGKEIASSIAIPPHIYAEIFALGCVVQGFFSTTPITFGAVAALVVINAVYTAATGVYHFVDVNISAAVFLGLHFLVTDPATSPRTQLGKWIFGVMYGTGVFLCYEALTLVGAHQFYDKLLVVPALNLLVRRIDAWCDSPIFAKLSSWETAVGLPRLKTASMACWIGFFGVLWSIGYVEAPHEGSTISFWKRAYAEGRFHSRQGLLKTVGFLADHGSGGANNELGVIYMEGKAVKKNRGEATRYFAAACTMGERSGALNTAIQFLFFREARSVEDAARALDALEKLCAAPGDDRAQFLVGYAHETGRGRPFDPAKALAYYQRCSAPDLYSRKGIARIGLSTNAADDALRQAAPLLESAAAKNDAESCWYLTYMYSLGRGVTRNAETGRNYLMQACKLGSAQACTLLQQQDLPPFGNPTMGKAPGWTSDYPLSRSAARD